MPPASSLPKPVARLLAWAQAQERTTEGFERREAWRFTRGLIGGVLAAGYPARTVGACLHISPQSVRDRAQRDAWLCGETVRQAIDIDLAGWQAWLEEKRLGSDRVNERGEVCLEAVEIVRALRDGI